MEKHISVFIYKKSKTKQMAELWKIVEITEKNVLYQSKLYEVIRCDID